MFAYTYLCTVSAVVPQMLSCLLRLELSHKPRAHQVGSAGGQSSRESPVSYFPALGFQVCATDRSAIF